ncbi:hypothetical protein WG29040_05445 [Pseudomonas sp. PAMC 29040]|uniref:hypothetical protein n=1 Tax=Pseudomonas sp. PAMC 29040 TaxID=2498450 RepID=UPI000FAFEFC9|nr:hypothetical protein [Pseudomonas sp. PAMC 29040]RUT39764.1 hypothetical protein WG29040_05445 [Pseudomonas sp. PAMC 29040]
MQNELKNAIRFDDFYAVYGSQGIVAMAWLLGSMHAESIRAEQYSFPFLHITGSAGSGKTSLMGYLWKLNEQDSLTSYETKRAHPAGLARMICLADNQAIVFEESSEPEPVFDWDVLAPLFNNGRLSVAGRVEQIETTFKGSVVICANPPIECSEAIESRLAHIALSAPHTNESRHHAMRLQELQADQARVFGRIVRERKDQLLSTFNLIAPINTSILLDQHGDQLSLRAAKNAGQLMALVDALSLLLDLSSEQSFRALNAVKYAACPEFVPY